MSMKVWLIPVVIIYKVSLFTKIVHFFYLWFWTQNGYKRKLRLHKYISQSHTSLIFYMISNANVLSIHLTFNHKQLNNKSAYVFMVLVINNIILYEIVRV